MDTKERIIELLTDTKRYGKSMANAWYHNPICKFMYFCDEIETITDKMNK